MKALEVRVKNAYSVLSDYTTELEKRLTVAYPNYWFATDYKSGVWDGKNHFLKIPSLKVPTGLLFIIKEYCEENNISLKVWDDRQVPKEIPPLTDSSILRGITLHDYQVEAVNKVLTEKRGVLELPTASGKTEIAIALVAHACLSTLYMVNTQDLLHQTAERFATRLGPNRMVGLIGDNEHVLTAPITIATVQTLQNMLKRELFNTKSFLNGFQMLIQDECHHSSSTSFMKPAMFMHAAYYRVGLSGTALRRDLLSNMKAMAALGPAIFSLKSVDLMNQGYIGTLEIRILNNTEGHSCRTWQQAYEEGIVENKTRNDRIIDTAEQALRDGKHVMVLVKHLRHGEILRSMLKIPVIFLCGADASALRKEIKEDFDQHGDYVLIASPIFDEGVDLPSINVLINASGGKSEWKTIQKVGRGLRKKAPGDKLIVYDFADQGKFLLEHSMERIAIYEREGFEVVHEGEEKP